MKSRYVSTRRLLCADPVVQDRVRLLRASKGEEKASSVGTLRSRKQSKRKRKEEIEITDAELMEVVHMEGFSLAPAWKDLLVLRMVFWPWMLAKFVYFRVRWIILFDLLRKEWHA